MPSPKTKLQNIDEIGRLFDASIATIRNWVKRGCPHTMEGSAYRFNAGAVAAWRKDRGLTGHPGRPQLAGSAELLAAKVRKETALAKTYEHELAVLQGDTTTVEKRRQHLQKCVQYVLAALVSPPEADDWTPKTRQTFADWHLGLRSWLQEEWYGALNTPQSARENPLEIIGAFQRFMAEVSRHGGELVGLDAAGISAKIYNWSSQFFAAIATGPAQTPEPVAAPVAAINAPADAALGTENL